MDSILIAKETVTYSAKIGGGIIAGEKEINLLDVGAVAIFTEDGTLITAATTTASISTQKQFKVCVGSAAGLRQSILIDRNGFNFNYCAYIAPVKHVVVIGYSTVNTAGASNLPTTPVAGTVASMSISYQDLNIEPASNTKRYDYTVKAGDTVLIIINALIAAVNADAAAYAVATLDASNDGIILTAKEFGHRLGTTTDDILIDATQQEDVAIVYGKGTPTEVAELEQLSEIEEGDTNRVRLPAKYYSAGSDVDTAATYDMYTMQWKTEVRNAINSQNVAIPSLILAIPNGTQQGVVDTILTSVLRIEIPSTGAGSSVSGW